MELVERHLVLEERPAERRLVVDERHLLLGRAEVVDREALLELVVLALELLEERRRDGEEVAAGELLDLGDLQGGKGGSATFQSRPGRSRQAQG